VNKSLEPVDTMKMPGVLGKDSGGISNCAGILAPFQIHDDAVEARIYDTSIHAQARHDQEGNQHAQEGYHKFSPNCVVILRSILHRRHLPCTCWVPIFLEHDRQRAYAKELSQAGTNASPDEFEGRKLPLGQISEGESWIHAGPSGKSPPEAGAEKRQYEEEGSDDHVQIFDVYGLTF